MRTARMARIGRFDTTPAEVYAKTVAALRRVGDLAGISRFDAWIAAWALEHGASVLTPNAGHFRRFAGLKVLSV